jgi:hypothetical protein
MVSRVRGVGVSPKHASAITSPTTSARPGAPSRSSVSRERSSGQRRRVAIRSTFTRLCSSGIDQSPLRRPASTCATGTPAASAAAAPPSVEFVSVDECPVRALAVEGIADTLRDELEHFVAHASAGGEPVGGLWKSQTTDRTFTAR